MSTTRIRAIMAELPSTVDGPKLLELVLEAALLLLEPLPKPKSRSKRSRYSSENDVLIEKSVKYTDFFLLSIVYV